MRRSAVAHAQGMHLDALSLWGLGMSLTPGGSEELCLQLQC